MSEEHKALTEVSFEELKAETQRRCPHKNEVVIPYGITGMNGDVICLDCGTERSWNAY